jgi:tripartite-type tricarboxylate transporter receptor subunit TctC
MRRTFHAVGTIFFFFWILNFAGPLAAEEFFAGKSITIVEGHTPGGGFDTYARLIGRHIKKHIPGKPNVVIQNMPGAGSLVAANYLYNNAKPDGLTMGMWNPSFIVLQALGVKDIKFNAGKFEWIGSPARIVQICAIMGFSGLHNWDEVRASTKPIHMAATRRGAGTYNIPTFLAQATGAKFQVTTGYAGTAKIRLALSTHEADGACWNWESMTVTAKDLLDAKGPDRLIPFLAARRTRDPLMKKVVLFRQVIKDKDDLTAFNAMEAHNDFFYPLMYPPGVSKQKLATVRRAFRQTMKDPAFLAEATKARLVTDYVSGREIEKRVREILAMPQKSKERLNFLVE